MRRGIAIAGLAILSGTMRDAGAQPSPRRSGNNPAALSALDTWLVSRYRRVQLLPDSLTGRMPLGEEPSSRVESAGDAATADTLFAIQFRTRREMSSLRAGARVRLTGPSGTITTTSAVVIARRPFRAPRRPGADTSADGWRYGWAYLALVGRQHAATSALVYRGWSLLVASDSLRRP